LFSQRYQDGAALLGHDKAAVRLSGVYAIVGLADDWEDQRQQCIEVLCAYLRLPYDPESSEEQPGEREVRLTVFREIGAHLRSDAEVSWSGRNFNFAGAVFDGGDFRAARFTGGRISFADTTFVGAGTTFAGAEFTGCTVTFARARIAASRLTFADATFRDGELVFTGANFESGVVTFTRSCFLGGRVTFARSVISGGRLSFADAQFSGGLLSFFNARLTAGAITFARPTFSGWGG
jgi:hypothetical protein